MLFSRSVSWVEKEALPVSPQATQAKMSDRDPQLDTLGGAVGAAFLVRGGRCARARCICTDGVASLSFPLNVAFGAGIPSLFHFTVDICNPYHFIRLSTERQPL